jgi:hypothetical protein
MIRTAAWSRVVALAGRHRLCHNDCHGGRRGRADRRGYTPAGAGGFVADGAGASAGIGGDLDGRYGHLTSVDLVTLVRGDDSHDRGDICSAIGMVSERVFSYLYNIQGDSRWCGGNSGQLEARAVRLTGGQIRNFPISSTCHPSSAVVSVTTGVIQSNG